MPILTFWQTIAFDIPLHVSIECGSPVCGRKPRSASNPTLEIHPNLWKSWSNYKHKIQLNTNWHPNCINFVSLHDSSMWNSTSKPIKSIYIARFVLDFSILKEICSELYQKFEEKQLKSSRMSFVCLFVSLFP